MFLLPLSRVLSSAFGRVGSLFACDVRHHSYHAALRFRIGYDRAGGLRGIFNAGRGCAGLGMDYRDDGRSALMRFMEGMSGRAAPLW